MTTGARDGAGSQRRTAVAPVLTCIPGQLDFIRARKGGDHRYRSVVRLGQAVAGPPGTGPPVLPDRAVARPPPGRRRVRARRWRPACTASSCGWHVSDLLDPGHLRRSTGRWRTLPSDPGGDPRPRQSRTTTSPPELTDQDRAAHREGRLNALPTPSGYARRVPGSGQTEDLWKELLGRSFRTTE